MLDEIVDVIYQIIRVDSMNHSCLSNSLHLG